MVSWLAAILAIISMAQPVKSERRAFSGDEIQIVPVSRSPESNTIALRVAYPRPQEIVRKNPVWIQFRVDGFALGAGSQGERTQELVNSKMGQTVRVVIDNRSAFAINEPALDPFNEDGYFYDTSYKFKLPFSLKEGMHSIRMFPARSFGECLKGENTYEALYFYVGEKEGIPEVKLSKPYLIYNEPSDLLKLVEEKPILFDFYLSNCELSADGYKVKLTIDEKIERTFDSWQPYYIYGLQRGKHTIRLQLLDEKGNQVPGCTNDVQRTIQIH